ncbi:hypothetical protein SAMN05660350_00161 [Geodermatophilus obscurus]|uniref:Uncharacterized protein n=1 Tax=Geodermatophilus obscurus TaxID=1861 RepID=A0A1M7RW54_9ACTN|nr:hypothetical protein SAMN05660350_00161 [Geodermatophilus obscurus]
MRAAGRCRGDVAALTDPHVRQEDPVHPGRRPDGHDAPWFRHGRLDVRGGSGAGTLGGLTPCPAFGGMP